MKTVLAVGTATLAVLVALAVLAVTHPPAAPAPVSDAVALDVAAIMDGMQHGVAKPDPKPDPEAIWAQQKREAKPVPQATLIKTAQKPSEPQVPSPKKAADPWQYFEADNGMALALDTRSLAWAPNTAIVYGPYVIDAGRAFDPTLQHRMSFDCHGGASIMGHSGEFTSVPVPPRSILGAVANVVCHAK